MGILQAGCFQIYYDDKVPTASVVSASSSDASYPVSRLGPLDIDRRTQWKAGATGTQYVRFVFPAALYVNGVAVLNHNAGTAGASSIEVQRSPDDATWTTVGSQTVPGYIDDNDYVLRTQTGQYRYWRVRFVGTTAAVMCGRLYLAGQYRNFNSSDSQAPCSGSKRADTRRVDVRTAESGLQFRNVRGPQIPEITWLFPDGVGDTDLTHLKLLFEACEGAGKSFIAMNPEDANGNLLAALADEVCLADTELARTYLAGNAAFTLAMRGFR